MLMKQFEFIEIVLFIPETFLGMESLEERRLRAAREAEERERKLRELEMMRNRKVNKYKLNFTNIFYRTSFNFF